MSEASLRIKAGTERLRALRTRLEVVPPRLEELERSAESAAADRDSVVRLEAALAEREELRTSVRERLSELGRMLGSV